MEVHHKSLVRREESKAEPSVVWDFLNGKAAAAGGGCSSGGGVIGISSLHLQSAATATLVASLDLPPSSRQGFSFSQPHSPDQLRSLFTLVSCQKQASSLLADQYYFSSQFSLPPAATIAMPGPLRERDPNARRPSMHFLDNLRPKSRLAHQRMPDHELFPAVEAEENLEPRFMASTTASSSRSNTSNSPPTTAPKIRRAPTPHSLLTLGALAAKSTSGEDKNDDSVSSVQIVNLAHPTSPGSTPSVRFKIFFTQYISLTAFQHTPHTGSRVASSKPALDKPLPSRPVAQVITNSPYKEGRTLIDASEKPLRRSPGTPDEEDWPALFPTQHSASGTVQTSHAPPSPKQPPASTRMLMDHTVHPTRASRSEQRPTIKMLSQASSDDIPSDVRHAEKISPPRNGVPSDRDMAVTTTSRPASPPVTPRMKNNATASTTPASLPQPKPRLVNIHSPKSRQGRRPPVTGSGNIPRPRIIPRPSGGSKQGNDTRPELQEPLPNHARGYHHMDASKQTSPERKPVNGGTVPPRSPTNNHAANLQRKKSAIPVPARTASPQMIPSGPAVFTLKAQVSTPSLGGKSLSTIESADTGRIEHDADTSTVMRPGPQRRPTLSKSAREFKHLSASTDNDPTMSAQTETSVSRPSSRTESLLWVETGNSEGTRTKRLSSAGMVSDYGPTLTISPDAEEMIMGRKMSPSPPVPSVVTAPARSSGPKTRDLHRMAVTNEHRKAFGESGVTSGGHAKPKTAASVENPRRQGSADSIQAETFTVKSTAESKNASMRSSSHADDSLLPPNTSRIEETSSDDTARRVAVSETLAKLEGGYRKGPQGHQLDQDAALARAFTDNDRKSPSSAQSTSIFKSSRSPRGSNTLARSDSGLSVTSNKRLTKLPMSRSSSIISVASSRPPVPPKDSRPTSRAPYKDPSIQKRKSSVRNGTTGLRSPYGLASGYSATPSNIPQLVNGRESSARFSSGYTIADTSRSISGEKRSVSRAKLTMSGFRGLFHKRADVKTAPKGGVKKKRSNMKVTSTGSPVPEHAYRATKGSSVRGSPGRLGTLTKACPRHPAEILAASPPPDTPQVSELTQTTALAMHITTLARGEEDDSKRSQLLSVASAMVGAIESAKHAKIEAEKAAQSAREASMHQEMTRQSLIAINKIFTNSPDMLGTLTRSHNNLRQRSQRPSTLGR